MSRMVEPNQGNEVSLSVNGSKPQTTVLQEIPFGERLCFLCERPADFLVEDEFGQRAWSCEAEIPLVLRTGGRIVFEHAVASSDEDVESTRETG
jgi:hypothetical protein